MLLKLDVGTPDPWLVFDLIGEGRSLGTGTIARIPGRARLQLAEIGDAALGFVLFFQLGAAGSVIADWLYETLKDRATTVAIDGVEVPIRRRSLHRLLSERIQQVELAAVQAGMAF